MQSGFDINELVQEAKSRWLKPAEVYHILQNHESHQLTQEPPQKPSTGSLFLFNKRVLRFFRKDGHSWRKKKDGRTVGEAHERLKVGNVEALNCYYAHGEQNPKFQRRSYWMLDPAYEHIVLVHYRDINEGRHNAGSSSYFSLGSPSTISQSPSSCTGPNLGSVSGINELSEPHSNSFSPGSVEVSSESIITNNGKNHLDRTEISGELSNSSDPEEVGQALRRLEQQLSLNDNDKEEGFPPFYGSIEKSEDSEVQGYEGMMSKENVALIPESKYRENGQCYSGYAGMHDPSNVLPHNAGNSKNQRQQLDDPQYVIEGKNAPSWKEMLSSTDTDFQEKYMFASDGNENPSSSLEKEKSSGIPVGQQEFWPSRWPGFGVIDEDGNKNNYYPTCDTDMNLQLSAAKQFLLGPDNIVMTPTSTSLLQEVENSKQEANPDYYSMWFDRETQLGTSIDADVSLTVSQRQRFTICEISPEWGYAMGDTKVIITGSFLCNPSECAWMCMFGGIEVPAQMIQDGVLRCQAPPHAPGKVTICITTGNRESCSEVRIFEYRMNPRNFTPRNCPHCSSAQKEATKSSEELLLLVRFAQMLMCAPSISMDPWENIIEALLVGSGTPSGTMDWLLQELLKDKFQQWLSSKNQEQGDSPDCSLSKKEQGIIHMISGLGFEWALNPILNLGVSINFRDINGRTALHWAARFGREKMVAALIAAGASAGAVTDPTSQDPTGKTPAFTAASSGHKGLAGYLSEMALTSHLFSLTIEESELSKGSAAVEAEITLNRLSEGNLDATEDQLSLKDSLAAVRNAAQAAARIQSAFRAHSFKRRQQAAATVEEFGMSPDDIHGLSIASKIAFRNLRDHKLDTAAISIQKKYRGWKGRKDFLSLRQKVVKIQAHVRGHQMRKKYKVLIWTVGVLDKVILRWRRRGVGLRGFRPESEAIDESEDEDFLKVFRKQKVDVAIDEAVSRVLSMVECPEARQQYHRILESYREAKGESRGSTNEISNSQGNDDNMGNDDRLQFP